MTKHPGTHNDDRPRPRHRGASAFSAATRQKLLATLLKAAEAGDVHAAASVLELSAAAKRDMALAEALERIKAGEGAA